MSLNKDPDSGFTFSLLGSPFESTLEEDEEGEEPTEMQSLLDNEVLPPGTSGPPFTDNIGSINQQSPRGAVAGPSSRASPRQNGPAVTSGVSEFPDVHVVDMPTSSAQQTRTARDAHVHEIMRRETSFSGGPMMDSQMEENVKCFVSSGIFFAIVAAVFIIMFVWNPMM